MSIAALDVLPAPAGAATVPPQGVAALCREPASRRIHVAWNDADLERRWDGLLAGRREGGVCNTYAWARSWSQCVGPKGTLCVAERAVTGAASVITPLAVHDKWWGRWLRFLGEALVSGDHLDLLAGANDASSAATLLLDLLDPKFSGAVGATLVGMDADSPTVGQLLNQAPRRGLAVRVNRCGVAPYLDLPATLEEFEALLSANMRYHVRRRRRGFARMRGAEVRVVREPEDVPGLLKAFFALHENRWAQEGQAGHYHDARRREFLENFCGEAARRGWLRGFMLCTAEAVEGVLIAFHFGRSAAYYQMGWRPGGAVESPGVVLLDASIRQALAEGLARFDFLRGGEAYKARWTKQAKTLVCVTVGRALRGRCVVHAGQAADYAKSMINLWIAPKAAIEWGGQA